MLPSRRKGLLAGFAGVLHFCGWLPPKPPLSLATTVELERLRFEVERLRVQLAGTLAAADGMTTQPAQPGDFGWSPAYQAVLTLRRDYDALVRRRLPAQQLDRPTQLAV